MTSSPPVPRPPHHKPLPLTLPQSRPLANVFAFVDESGDRNFKPNRQSDYFSMTAVLVAEENLDDLRVAIGGLRYAFGVTGALHWKVHCRSKRVGRRDLVARTMAAIPGTRVVHVVWDKGRHREEAYVRSDQRTAYHWVSKFPTELVAHVAQNWEGGPRAAILNFGVVGGVEHTDTLQYLEHVRRVSPTKRAHPFSRAVPWQNLMWPPKWYNAAHWDGLQAADLYSGMLSAAVKDNHAQWLVATRHQLFRRAGDFEGYGIKTLPTSGMLAQRDWWHLL